MTKPCKICDYGDPTNLVTELDCGHQHRTCGKCQTFLPTNDECPCEELARVQERGIENRHAKHDNTNNMRES